jgi:hypothetical protein
LPRHRDSRWVKFCVNTDDELIWHQLNDEIREGERHSAQSDKWHSWQFGSSWVSLDQSPAPRVHIQCEFSHHSDSWSAVRWAQISGWENQSKVLRSTFCDFESGLDQIDMTVLGCCPDARHGISYNFLHFLRTSKSTSLFQCIQIILSCYSREFTVISSPFLSSGK